MSDMTTYDSRAYKKAAAFLEEACETGDNPHNLSYAYVCENEKPPKAPKGPRIDEEHLDFLTDLLWDYSDYDGMILSINKTFLLQAIDHYILSIIQDTKCSYCNGTGKTGHKNKPAEICETCGTILKSAIKNSICPACQGISLEYSQFA